MILKVFSNLDDSWIACRESNLHFTSDSRVVKSAQKTGLSCSRATIINVSSKVGSIGLCLGVLEVPMYPYRASKVRGWGRHWGPWRGAHGTPHLPQATHPQPDPPRVSTQSASPGCAHAPQQGKAHFPPPQPFSCKMSPSHPRVPSSLSPVWCWHGRASSRLPRTW